MHTYGQVFLLYPSTITTTAAIVLKDFYELTTYRHDPKDREAKNFQ